MSDVMSVRLHLWGVRVRGVGVDSVDRLEVEVESTREWSRCPHCGFRCHKVWDRRAKRVRDLGVSGRRATLVWRRRRFECGNCGERHLEDHDQFAGGLTRRFARRLVQDGWVMSIRAVSRHHGVGWHRIMGLVRAEAAVVAQRRRARLCRVLLVNETSIRRRHRYVTVVACGDSGKILAMIPGRTKGSLSRFFRDQGAWWCRQVEIVVSDGSRSYQAAIAQYLPGCPPCARPLSRRPLVHPRPHPGTPGSCSAATPISGHQHTNLTCFRARFTLLRRSDHLTEAHQAHLDRLFDAHPRLRTAWDALFKSSTSYTKPTTRTKPTRRSDGSPTSTPPARYPNTTKSWTPSSHGEHKSWPTTPPDDGYPTDPSKGSTTSTKSYDASPTGSPTPTITPPEESS